MLTARASFPVFTVLIALATSLVCAAQSGSGPAFKVLHAFNGGSQGSGLWGSLVLDNQGNLYGTTFYDSAPGEGGTAFKLTPQPDGQWLLSTLHVFGKGNDGGASTAGMIFDSVGSLYGTTGKGGTHGFGTVFKLTPTPKGWAEKVLYNFPLPGPGGCCPYGGVVRDKSGNLYGATYSAFELSPTPQGWKPTLLHNFTGLNGDGSGPQAGLILDGEGNLYGTTRYGGTSKNCGGGGMRHRV
jgi:uncharacterized repeat protein (TIGR03803 family)